MVPCLPCLLKAGEINPTLRGISTVRARGLAKIQKMANEKKASRHVVYVRRDDHPYSLRMSLPSRWQRDSCFKVLRVFVESFNKKFADEKIDINNAHLYGDRSCRVIDLETPVCEMDEETVWVRIGTPDQNETTTALSSYVPRVLVPRKAPNLSEMRVENQTMLVGRAQKILDLFGALSDDRTVRAVRRYRRAKREERLVAQCDRFRYEIRSVLRDQDDYCDAICRVWNERLSRRPCVPLRRENGRVVAAAFEKKWILRPHADSEPCVDPARLGQALGDLHAKSQGAHQLALNAMEVRPKPYAERIRAQIEDLKKVADNLPEAISERLDRIDVEAVASLRQCWTHASFRSDTCRLQSDDDVVVVEGIENSRVGNRLEDFYDLVLWDGTPEGLKLGLQAFPVVARNYVLACDQPFTTTEAGLFPDVLWLRALIDAVGSRRASRKRFDILDQLEASSSDLSAALMDANPKYLESSASAATQKLLPAPTPPEEEEQHAEEEEEEEPSSTSNDFWSNWARDARQKKKKRVVGISSSPDNFRNVFDDCRVSLDDEGHPSIIEDFQVYQSSGLQRVTRLATPEMPQAAACVIHLERNVRRGGHVAEHLKKVCPGIKVIAAIDAMIQGELEKADRPTIDESRWEMPSRGQVACASSHLAVWRSFLDSSFPHLVVLEDDAELATRFLESLALLLAEIPADYDLLYLHVPPDRRREGEGRILPAFETTTLTAYVISSKGAATLIDLLDEKGLDSPIDLFVNARALDGSISAFAVTDKDLARSRGDKSIAFHCQRYLPSTIVDTPPWLELHRRVGQD